MQFPVVATLFALALAAAFHTPSAKAQVPATQTPTATAAEPVPAPPTVAPLADGEVRKVDKAAGKITLRHGPIPSLDMPDMTMVFRVKDPAMLDQVKVGDRVRFAADKIGGQYTVVKIEPAK